jgi:hypothetical protein
LRALWEGSKGEDLFLPDKGAQQGEHNSREYGDVANPKAEGPLDEVRFGGFDLLVQLVDLFAQGLVNPPQFFAQRQLRLLEIFVGRGFPLYATLDKLEECSVSSSPSLGLSFS